MIQDWWMYLSSAVDCVVKLPEITMFEDISLWFLDLHIFLFSLHWGKWSNCAQNCQGTRTLRCHRLRMFGSFSHDVLTNFSLEKVPSILDKSFPAASPWLPLVKQEPAMNHASDQSKPAVLTGAERYLSSSSIHLLPHDSGHSSAALRGRRRRRGCRPHHDQTLWKWVLFSSLWWQVSSSLHCLCSWYLLVPIC